MFTITKQTHGHPWACLCLENEAKVAREKRWLCGPLKNGKSRPATGQLFPQGE